MRKKTDEKRMSIMDATYELFRTKGLKNTSMAEIKARAGCGKATLYNYFSSKEDLFVQCMLERDEVFMEDIFSSFQDPRLELAAQLQDFGVNIMRKMTLPDILASRRLMIAESERKDVGDMIAKRTQARVQMLVSFLQRAMNEGKLRSDDSLIAAKYLYALLEAEVLSPVLTLTRKKITNRFINHAVTRVVSAFLMIYTPQKKRSNRPR